MKYRSVPIIMALAMVSIGILLINGCGTNSTSPPASSSAPPSSQSSNSAASSQQVVIENFTFTPAELTVKAGSTVKWVNKDSAIHTIQGQTFTSPPLSADQAFEYTFSAPGRYDYICSNHPSMKAVIIVQ